MPFLEAEQLGFGKDFENAHPLWNAEVSFILDKYLENASNTTRNIPQNGMIQRTLEYVRKLNNYANPQNSQAARELMQKGDKFTHYESALINNLNIGSVDEAITLIPSLKDKFPNTDLLQTRLQHLQDFQKNDDINYNMQPYNIVSNNFNNNNNTSSSANTSLIPTSTALSSTNINDNDQKDDDDDVQITGSNINDNNNNNTSTNKNGNASPMSVGTAASTGQYTNTTPDASMYSPYSNANTTPYSNASPNINDK